jgi:very-short-patch-repair endonuclease
VKKLRDSQHSSPPTEGCPDTSGRGGSKQLIGYIYDHPFEFRPVIHLPYTPQLKLRARYLRRSGNLPEVKFWMEVHRKKFHGIDFDRQRVIGNYIVDFYVKRLGLVVEIDGSSHDYTQEYDRCRDEFLSSLGLKVYRISVGDVLNNMRFVLMGLENFILEHYGV